MLVHIQIIIAKIHLQVSRAGIKVEVELLPADGDRGEVLRIVLLRVGSDFARDIVAIAAR